MKRKNVCLSYCDHYHRTHLGSDHCEKTSPHKYVNTDGNFQQCHHDCGFTIERHIEDIEEFKKDHTKGIIGAPDWECDCGTMNTYKMEYCTVCGEKRPSRIPSLVKETCPDCGHPTRHDAPCPCKHPDRR